MDLLPGAVTAEALAAAEAEADPASPAASTRLRRQFAPEVVAASVSQVLLRRRAVTKFGSAAATMFFTADGLEQATRPTVGAHHARRLVAAGARSVVDLGCGIGTDAAAFAAAGLTVTAVERDPTVAAVARANLPDGVSVLVADAQDVDLPDDPTAAVFLDPARRTGRGRSWRVEDLSPPWTFVESLLGRRGPVVVKLGPGFPLSHLPADVEAEWIAADGDTVELALWSGPGAEVGRRSALALPGPSGDGPANDVRTEDRLVADRTPVPVGPVGAYVYEPVGAVTRAGALGALARLLDGRAINPDLPYLSSDTLETTPYATAFAVREVFAYREKDLKAWVRSHDVGVLEILTRGLDIDPALLRRRLRPAGRTAATLVITRTTAGKQVLVVERTAAPGR